MLDSFSILINGITLALAFGLLLIVLWHDARKPLHRYFAIFLILVMLWNAGALLTQTALLIGVDETLLRVAVAAMELGFSGASVAGPRPNPRLWRASILVAHRCAGLPRTRQHQRAARFA